MISWPRRESRCAGSGLSLQVKIPGPGRLFLPVPLGHAIQPDRVSINRANKIPVRQNSSGEVFITISEQKGHVDYHCCPLAIGQEMDAIQLGKLTGLPPDLIIPLRVEQALKKASPTSIEEKIQTAIALTRANFIYDRSDRTAGEYEKKSGHSDWAEKVFDIGKGDCDIINGITALLLRRLGVPSRMVIGLIGEKGKVVNLLHAWIEYYHNGWRTLDSSATIQSSPATESNGSERSADGGQKRSGKPGIYFLICMVICFLPLFILFMRKKKEKPVLSDALVMELKEVLARIALGWILHPRLGKMENSIGDAEIIPAMGGKSLSPRKVLSLSQKGKLLVGSIDNPLSAEFAKKGYPVLDQRDPAFQNLIKQLPDSINLDMIQNLNTTNPENIRDNPRSRLLAIVNQGMSIIGKGLLPGMWCPGLTGIDFLSIRMPGNSARSGRTWFFRRLKGRANESSLPHRFVAVNPRGKNLGEYARLFLTNPSLARYKTIKALIRASGFFPEEEKRLLKKVSLFLLKEMA